MELDPLVDVEDRRIVSASSSRRCWAYVSAGVVGSALIAIAICYGERLHFPVATSSDFSRYFKTIWVAPKHVRSLVQDAPNHAVVVSLAHYAHAEEGQIKRFRNLTGWPPAKLLNAGKDCWQPCGNVSGDCAWCGLGNACCRFNAEHDPDECRGVTFTVKDRHTCVTPVTYHALKHARQDCFGPCGKSGYCSWCGAGHTCCMASATSVEAPECRGAFGFHGRNSYECVSTLGPCEFMEVADGKGCKKPDRPQQLAFYMYKAAGPDYPKVFNQTGSLGTLGGVMWYLHNHVVTECPRLYAIDRIRRYFVTIKSTDALHAATAKMFDRYSEFENGVAQDSWSTNHWVKYGYNPGCLHVDPQKNSAAYGNAVWYSMPGKCPSMDLYSRTAKCLREEPGGNCDAPNGTPTCTWHAQFAGEVFLDELAGIPDHASFCAAGNYEFDLETDAGIGNDFWNGKLSVAACDKRMKRVYQLFEGKYPELAYVLDRHPCDADEP